MVVPPKHPKMIIFSRKTLVVGYHHFRKPPYSSVHQQGFHGFRLHGHTPQPLTSLQDAAVPDPCCSPEFSPRISPRISLRQCQLLLVSHLGAGNPGPKIINPPTFTNHSNSHWMPTLVVNICIHNLCIVYIYTYMYIYV